MFACIYVPDFPVEALVRAEPSLRARAIAVLEGKPPLTRVIALNERARGIGLEVGMTKLQAAAFAEKTENAETAQPTGKHGGSDLAVRASPRADAGRPPVALRVLSGNSRHLSSAMERPRRA